MPITTFITPLEKEKFKVVSDKELNSFLQEVRNIDERFYLEERFITKKVGWFKTEIVAKYQLYYDYLYPKIKSWDIQIVNLGGCGAPVTRQVIGAYLLGFLSRR